MNFKCEKDNLLNAINRVIKSVSTKGNVPVLSGIMIEAKDEKLLLTGYDLDMAIKTEIAAKITQEGAVVIEAKLLDNIIRNCASEVVEFEVSKELAIVINSGTSVFEITGMTVLDFPDLPNPMAEPTCKINGQFLKELIDTTIYAVAQEDKKPTNTGELLWLRDNQIYIVGLDGFRLAVCQRDFECENNIKIIIPGKTMAELSRLISDSNDEIEISASNRYVVFKTDDYYVMSRLIEGDYLDFEKVIPEGFVTSAEVEVNPFLKSIDRASLIITERMKNPLRIKFDKTHINVSCKTGLGQINDDINAVVSGIAVEIGFNNKYLSDCLKATGCERVIFEIQTALNAVKVRPIEGNKFTFLVLPVRFKE